jgi:transcription initiation factor TFIIH subunit 2
MHDRATSEPTNQSIDQSINSGVPWHGSREVVVLYGALTTRDHGDITHTIDELQQGRVRVSVVGLGAEVHVLARLARNTHGSYQVAPDHQQVSELLLAHCPPPPCTADTDTLQLAALIHMGFPKKQTGVQTYCGCHNELRIEGYECPRCQTLCCELPAECAVCGLSLILSPHLARSYHHLFPVLPFDEVKPAYVGRC